jgi:hypothetical protein
VFFLFFSGAIGLNALYRLHNDGAFFLVREFGSLHLNFSSIEIYHTMVVFTSNECRELRDRVLFAHRESLSTA